MNKFLFSWFIIFEGINSSNNIVVFVIIWVVGSSAIEEINSSADKIWVVGGITVVGIIFVICVVANWFVDAIIVLDVDIISLKVVIIWVVGVIIVVNIVSVVIIEISSQVLLLFE